MLSHGTTACDCVIKVIVGIGFQCSCIINSNDIYSRAPNSALRNSHSIQADSPSASQTLTSLVRKPEVLSFSHGSTAQLGPAASLLRLLDHTQLDTHTRAVGPL
jgi:hypothetical protein